MQTIDFDFKNPDYTYNPETRKYTSSSGKEITQSEVQSLILKRIEAIALELQDIGRSLVNGDIDLGSWQRQTAEKLKILHAQQFLLGVGGLLNIEFDDYLVLARKVKEQYKYLREFAIAVKKGEVSPTKILYRLGLYPKAAKGTYYLGYRQSAKRNQKAYGFRKLGDAEHCPDCIKYEAMGILPIDDLILPTEKCQCAINCKCSIIYLSLAEMLAIQNKDADPIKAIVLNFSYQQIKDVCNDYKLGTKGNTATLQQRFLAHIAGFDDTQKQGVLKYLQSYSFDASEDFYQEYAEELKSTSGYIVDKNGRWRDRNGRFIEMPSLNDPEIKKYITSKIADGDGRKIKNLISDIRKTKLLSLSTSQAYKATVQSLRSKYKKDSFELSVIASLQLDRGVSNKKNASRSIQELEAMLVALPEAKKVGLNQKLRSIDLSEIPIKPDMELEAIANDLQSKTGDQAAKDKRAVEAIALYRQSVGELNSILTEINSKNDLTEDDYNRLYDQRQQAWSKMKSALDVTHEIKDDYLSSPRLDEYVDTLRKVSRESPGGFKIVLPKTLEDIKEKAKQVDC